MDQPDVVDLIEGEHREFERLLAQLKEDMTRRPELMNELTMTLTAHERAEEAEVYPVAAKTGEAPEVAHSVDEHLEADRLLARLTSLEPASPDFDMTLAELANAVQHHIDEEESTVLPHMREKLSVDRRRDLGAAFLAARGRYIDQQPEDAAPLGDTWVP